MEIVGASPSALLRRNEGENDRLKVFMARRKAGFSFALEKNMAELSNIRRPPGLSSGRV